MKKIFFIPFLLFSYTIFYAQIPTNGLIAHYELNGNGIDSSPLSNNGTPQNVIATEDRFNNQNMAYSFNGVNSRIECGTNTLPYKDSLTITGWVKTTDSKYQWVAGKYVFTQDKGFLLYINEGKLRLDGRDGNGAYITNKLSEIEINDGQWHFVAGTIAKNEWAVYVDCEYQGSVFTQNADVNLQPNIEFNIGNNPRDPGGNKQFFNGAIDDVYLYNRSLSQNELLSFLTLRNSSSLTLNGKTDYLEIPNNPLLNVSNNLTIECWVKPNCSDGNRMIVSKEWCLDSQFSYYLSIIDEKLAWTFDSDGYCDVPNRYQTSNITVPANQFTHIAMVHSDTEIKLYINGNLATSQYTAGAFSNLVDSKEPIRIGSYKGIAGNFGNYLSGQIDDLRFWNKALTGQEIASRINKKLIGTESGLLINFDMEEEGIGKDLILKNKSSYGSTFDAATIGFTSNTPFIGTLTSQCEQPNFIIQTHIDTCAIEIEISLDVSRYCNILWNDGISSKTRKISQTGQYSVIVETELCNFLYDTINVQLGEIKNTNFDFNICTGDSIEVNSIFYQTKGNYFQYLTASNGCDSVLNIKINLIDLKEVFQDFNLCQGDSITIYENVYSEEGIYIQSLSSSNGCDSILNLTINIIDNSEQNINYTLCENEIIELNGIAYSMPGSFKQILTNSNGCDSILNINIEAINPVMVAYFDFEQCDALKPETSMVYDEFVPSIINNLDCGTISFSNIFRNNPTINKHSCTEGNTASKTMCVSSYQGCDFNTLLGSPIELNMDIAPEVNKMLSLTSIEFFHKSPTNFNWIQGASGLNNPPTKFGIKIVKNGQEIYTDSNISTDNNWQKHSINLCGIADFTINTSSKFTLLIMPYCPIGNGAPVSAFDIDDIKINASCLINEQGRFKGFVSAACDNNVAEIAISCTNSTGLVQSSITNSNGSFSFNNLPLGQEYKILPIDNSTPLQDISTLDLILIQRHLLSIEKFDNPISILAADTNFDNKISVSDLVELRKLLLGLIPDFSLGKSWKFYTSEVIESINTKSKSEGFSYYADGASVVKIFEKIKTGDVSSPCIDFRSNSKSVKISITKNQNAISFIADEDMSLFGMQIASNLLAKNTKEIISNKLSIDENNIHFTEEMCKIIFFETQKVEFKKGEELFTIQISQNSNTFELLNSNSFQNLIIDENLNETLITTKSVKNEPISIFPNPNTGIFNIIGLKDVEANSQLKIISPSGKVLLQGRLLNYLNNNQINLNNFQINNYSGILIVQVSNGEDSYSVKMMKI